MKRSKQRRRVRVSADGAGVVSHAWVGLLREMAEETGLVDGVTAALIGTYKRMPVHPAFRSYSGSGGMTGCIGAGQRREGWSAAGNA